MGIYKLSSCVYLQKMDECYMNVVTINKMPDGPLRDLVKQLKHNTLSPFQDNNNCCKTKSCILAIMNPIRKQQLLCIDDIELLFEFLVDNGYTFETSMSKIISKNNRLNNNDRFISLIKY